jgi:ACT domain-containing protein
LRISEDEIRKLTLQAIEELGEKATPDLVKQVVEKSVTSLGKIPEESKSSEISSGRIILTSFGINHPGIIAGVTTKLSEHGVDIKDVTQKILGEFYTMIMIIDISNSPNDLKEIQNSMNSVAEELKIKIYLQHEDVFRYMHRI